MVVQKQNVNIYLESNLSGTVMIWSINRDRNLTFKFVFKTPTNYVDMIAFGVILRIAIL